MFFVDIAELEALRIAQRPARPQLQLYLPIPQLPPPARDEVDDNAHRGVIIIPLYEDDDTE